MAIASRFIADTLPTLQMCYIPNKDLTFLESGNEVYTGGKLHTILVTYPRLHTILSTQGDLQNLRSMEMYSNLSLLRLVLGLNLIIGLALVVGVCSGGKYSRRDFPPDFVFGSGTSAYQVSN